MSNRDDDLRKQLIMMMASPSLKMPSPPMTMDDYSGGPMPANNEGAGIPMSDFNGGPLPPQNATPPSTIPRLAMPPVAPEAATSMAMEPGIMPPQGSGPGWEGADMGRKTYPGMQPAGMDQMGLAEQMAAREELARALNGTGGSNMLTRLFGMGG